MSSVRTNKPQGLFVYLLGSLRSGVGNRICCQQPSAESELYGKLKSWRLAPQQSSQACLFSVKIEATEHFSHKIKFAKIIT